MNSEDADTVDAMPAIQTKDNGRIVAITVASMRDLGEFVLLREDIISQEMQVLIRSLRPYGCRFIAVVVTAQDLTISFTRPGGARERMVEHV